MVSTRETKILIADMTGVFPANWLYPDFGIFPNGANVREITNIVAGTLKLDEVIVEKVPQFGQLFSSKFEVKIYMEENLSGKDIAVYQKGNDDVMRGVFFGKIDSCRTDRVGTDRTIVAYDHAYTVNALNVAPWWSDFWANRETATLKQVRDSLMVFAQLSAENVILPNDDLIVSKTVNFTSCTFQQMLKMICELNCCFPHVNRNGNMDYIVLDTDATGIDLEGRYEWTHSDFEEYETDAITGVQFFDSDNQLKWTVGQYENAYPISKNIFLYDAGTTTLERVGNTILSYLENLTYTPSNIKMIISDLDLHLGDYVSAETHSFYIFKNSLSGQQLIEQTIKADGSQNLYNGTAHLEYGELILNQKIARISYTVEEFYIEYGEYKEEEAIKESTYHGNYVPTNSNYPANEWITTSQKEAHLEEVFYNTATQKYYKWTKFESSDDPPVITYGWQEIDDLGYGRTLSLYRQNASQILMKVSKGTVSSELSLEPDQIRLASGRLIIDSGNFQLDEYGNMTATSATLSDTVMVNKASTNYGITIGEDRVSFTYQDVENAYINYTYSSSPFGQHFLNLYSDSDLRMEASEIRLTFDDLVWEVNGRTWNIYVWSDYYQSEDAPITGFSVDIYEDATLQDVVCNLDIDFDTGQATWDLFSVPWSYGINVSDVTREDTLLVAFH